VRHDQTRNQVLLVSARSLPHFRSWSDVSYRK